MGSYDTNNKRSAFSIFSWYKMRNTKQQLGNYAAREGIKAMSDMMTAAVTAMQSRIYDQISVSIIKMNADAQKAVADMITENAQRITELANKSSSSAQGRIDIYV
jgi:hypothetical protein